MDTFKNVRKIARQLRELGVESLVANMAAEYIVNKEPSKECLSQQDFETIDFVKSIAPLDQVSNLGNALMLGKEKLQETYSLLVKLCPEKDIQNFYYKQTIAFSIEKDDVEKAIRYLKSLEIEEQEISNVLILAIQLPTEELIERCELVLENWEDKDFLLYLIKEGCLLYPHYYVDVEDGIKTLVKELGPEVARILLESEQLYLYYWKHAEYRNDYTYGPQFKEALQILEKYKQNK